MVGAELIPGLHNELAMEVLLRMPEEYQCVAMEASSLWRIVLCSDRFHALRRLRSKPGRPSLLLLLRQEQCSSKKDLVELNLASASSKPRALFTSLHFSQDTELACLGENSLLALDSRSRDGWLKFDTSLPCLGKWTRFGQPGRFQADFFTLLGVLDTRIFVCGYHDRKYCDRTVLSYDYRIDQWDCHDGLLRNFFPNRLRFTFHGQIFTRHHSRLEPFTVYAFDPATTKWKEHEHMTKRLAIVPSWSRVAATHDGTLISASISEGKIQVKQQDERSFEWCSLLEVLVESYVWQNYFLFIEENHIFLVIEDVKEGAKKMCAREEHVLGQRRLTCVYVPKSLLMGAVLMHV